MPRRLAAAKIAVILTICAVAGTAFAGQKVKKPKTISYQQASAFETALLARAGQPPQHKPDLLIQPANKTEPCKLPTTQDQLDRPNFRAYWDGACKNGFAFGLGRDIAISDTHHVEEITIHGGMADDRARPAINFDFVNNRLIQTVGGVTFPEQITLVEQMETPISGFNIVQTLNIMDGSGNMVMTQRSVFNPQSVSLLSQQNGAIAFRFVDSSGLPAIEPNAATLSAEILDPQNNMASGISIIRYANGSALHLAMLNGKPQAVQFPDEYADHVMGKYQNILTATSRANASLQQVQQIEREYLFKACNGKSEIKGLSPATYSQICTWRDQFKQPYATAFAEYQQQMESARQQAAAAAQQRNAQEMAAAQLILQQRALQQQESAQNWAMWNQGNQMLQQQTQQTLQGIQNWQPPQVQPITPPGGYRFTCQRVNNLGFCRER